MKAFIPDHQMKISLFFRYNISIKEQIYVSVNYWQRQIYRNLFLAEYVPNRRDFDKVHAKTKLLTTKKE